MATDKKPLTREAFVIVVVLMELESLKDKGLVDGGVFDVDRVAAQDVINEGRAAGFAEPTTDEINAAVKYLSAGGQCEKDFAEVD